MLPLLQAGGAGGFWGQYGESLTNLAMIGGGIFVYGLIVNAFYQIISNRVMFGKKDAQGRVHVGGPGRGFLYLIAFPLVSLAFFLLISASLLFLSDEKTPSQVFTLSMAIVLAVRIAAYFSEPTSHDIAKMLPLGLLGVFIVTEDDFSGIVNSLANIKHIFLNLDIILIYFAVVVLVEYVLRLIYVTVQMSTKPNKPKMTHRPPNTQGGHYSPPQSSHNQPPQFRR